jgi:CTP synthase
VDLNPWRKITKIVLHTKKFVNIAIIGKYVNLKDAYKSLDEALIHGGIQNNLKVNLIRIESDHLKISDVKQKIKDVSGILIPGGFGKRGTEGKIAAINFSRKYKIPFLGICFGMQMAVIEFARNVLKIKNAGSTELNNNCYPVIGLIDEWNKDGKIIKGTKKDLGGTMRLGLYEAKLKHNSLIKNIYKSSSIKERHRHRYEVNNNLKNKFEEKGMIFSGMSPDNQLPEIVELKNHPWFIGVQFHPEFKSRPLSAHPLFSSFIKAAKNHK